MAIRVVLQNQSLCRFSMFSVQTLSAVRVVFVHIRELTDKQLNESVAELDFTAVY